MADLGTTYLGLELDHPIISGACPLADTLDGARRLEDAGAAAVVLRSLYEEQLRAEAFATHESLVASTESFPESSTFLPEPDEFILGPDEYLGHLARVHDALDVPVIASLNGAAPGPWLDYAPMMEQAGADALELNIYEVVTDPVDTAELVESRLAEIVREVASRTALPIAVKLAPFYTSFASVAARVEQAGARGLVLFNRFFEPDIDTENIEVAPHLELSSRSELLLRLRWLAIVSGRIDADLAVSGGVHSEIDAVKAVMSGARAVQIVSEPLKGGAHRFGEIRDALNDWLDEHEYESVSQMRGSMNLNRCPDPTAFTRTQYIRMILTWRPQD